MQPLPPGSRVPDAQLSVVEVDGGSPASTKSAAELFGRGKHVLVGIPGAFTPVCTSRHVPGFIDKAPQLAEQGWDVAVLCVNDKFTARAWADSLGVFARHSPVKLVADGACEFSKQLGVAKDFSDLGLGWRCRRFACLIADGKVQRWFLEKEPNDLNEASAEAVLGFLQAQAGAAGGKQAPGQQQQAQGVQPAQEQRA